MRNSKIVTSLAGAAVLLSACSDSGDAPPPPPPPPAAANMAPSITSAASVTVDEDLMAAQTLTADDPDGDALTFSIDGGADAAFFDITNDGVLTFSAAPNFERPQDSNLDNLYEVEVMVSDGAASDRQTLEITVRNANEPYVLRRVATGLAAPLFLTGRPGSDDVFVTERGGVVRLMDPATGDVDPVPYLDISTTISTAGEGGLIGFAPSPTFAADGVVYLHVTNLAGDTEVRRYGPSSADPSRGDPTSADVIFTTGQPATNHNGGWIGFDDSGLLYIALGDGGGSGDVFGNGQDPNTVLGSILRIDPSRDDFSTDDSRDYGVPPANPFASGSGGAPEVFAFGLRNPFRASFDPATGDLWIGDVGQNAFEEIDVIRDAASRPAAPVANFGWPAREATARFNSDDDPAFTDPVIEYAHGETERAGRSVAGGYVYRGSAPGLEDRYFFADFISDNIWSVPTNEVRLGETLGPNDFIVETDVLTPDAGTVERITSFGEDNDGELYILTIGGDIFRIEAR